jgi:hypothetical protein
MLSPASRAQFRDFIHALWFDDDQDFPPIIPELREAPRKIDLADANEPDDGAELVMISLSATISRPDEIFETDSPALKRIGDEERISDCGAEPGRSLIKAPPAWVENYFVLSPTKLRLLRSM